MEKVDNDSESLNKKMAACQHLIDDMHAEHGIQEVFNFSLTDLDNKKLNEELDEVFDKIEMCCKS